MNPLLTHTRAMNTLFRREWLEFRLVFAYVPLMLLVTAMAWFIMWLLRGAPQYFGVLDIMRSENMPLFASDELAGFRDTRVTIRIFSMYALFRMLLLATFWVSMMYYCLFSLYRQRRDRSILFWNSMPVSSAQTIAAKLLAGLIGCHLLFVLVLALLDLFILLTVGTYSGNEIPDWNFYATGWDIYLSQTQPLSRVFDYLLRAPAVILWSLPAYGWLLLASAWSRRAPFAWAAGPWILVILIEAMLTGKSRVFKMVVEHLLPFAGPGVINGVYPASELVVSAVLGLAFVYAAVRLNRSDDN